MHPEAYKWVAQHATVDPVLVLDIGGRNINGTTRDLFPNAEYVALDILPDLGTDIVADAATWEPDRQYDIVVSTECFEHADQWREIVKTVARSLRPGGKCIFTMAGPGRGEHSGIDGEFKLYPGEYYGNVDPIALQVAMEHAGLVDIVIDQQVTPADVRAVAYKP